MHYRDDYDRGRRQRDERYEREYDDREDYRRDRRDYPGFIERLGQELRSWFHEDESRQRWRDERGDERGWGGGNRGWGASDDAERDWARQWGYVEGGERGRGRGDSTRGNRWSEERGRGEPRGGDRWSDERRGDDRWSAGRWSGEQSSGPQRYVGDAWTRERGYGGEGYGAERRGGDRYYEPRSGWGDASAWGSERTSEAYDRSGPHAGRGPRGYQRSDERIREDVCDRLCEHGYIDASQIDVAVQNGEVTLSGSVSERQEKRMAEDVVDAISGVRQVHNQLRVSPGGTGEEPPSAAGDPRFRIA
jgi:osmotically-inducible protein OsmY